MSKPFLKVDLAEFVAGAKQHVNRDWPKACVNAFAEIAEEGRDDVRTLTRREFKLHSDFVTKGIRHLPNTPTQKDAAARALQRFGDMSAAVFLRGASDPRKSLEFMAHHEWGETRDPQDRFIAVPLKGVRSKSFKTSKGRVQARWKPGRLLEHFNKTGSRYDGRTTQHRRGLGYKGRSRRLPGKPFLIRSQKGDPLIARRIRNPNKRGQRQLEFFYILKPKARIQKIWNFVDGVYTSVGRHFTGKVTKHVAMMPDR